MDLHTYINLFIALIAITNPIGAVAIFISLVGDRSPADQRKEAIKAMISIFIILVIVTWSGDLILRAFAISPSAFEVGGALIIILLGLSMLNAHSSKAGYQHSSQNYTKEEHNVAKQQDSIAVVPMSLPLVAGPGAITTLIIHLNHMPDKLFDKMITSGVCLLLALIIGAGFLMSKQIHKLLGDSGIKIATRIMGLILIAIAFSMLQSGLTKMFPGLS